MKKSLKIIEKEFKKYGWMPVVFYILGYTLIRFQYARYGILDVQFFKEKYILAGLLFLFFCFPLFLVEYLLNINRSGKTSKTFFVYILTTPAIIWLLFFMAINLFIYNNEYIINIFGILWIVFIAIADKVFNIIEVKFKEKEKLINCLDFLLPIVHIIYVCTYLYAIYDNKYTWLNTYYNPLIIIEIGLIIRIILEQLFIKKTKNENMTEQNNRIKMTRFLLIAFMFSSYSNIIFNSFPAEIGGGSILEVRIETEDNKLSDEISNQNTYLLDRSGDTYILVVKESNEEKIYKTIEVSKDKAILVIDKN